MTPLVSVVIPCYRQARFLPQALRSVFRQSYPAVECIVVNDGSDDDTESVARPFLDRIKYLHQPNGGVSAARNCGIQAAGGEYLLFLDADDLLRRDAIRWLVEGMEGRDDRVCLMGSRTFDSNMPAKGRTNPVSRYPGLLAARLLHENIAAVNAWLCPRKRVLDVGGFDVSVPACEDWDLWLRLALAGAELVAVPRIGAYYRRYAGSLSCDPIFMSRGRALVLQHACQALQARPDICRRWKLDPQTVMRTLLHDVRNELLDAAYLSREAGDHGGAFVDYLGSMYRGEWSRTALLGIVKLLPHRLLRARTAQPSGVKP